MTKFGKNMNDKIKKTIYAAIIIYILAVLPAVSQFGKNKKQYQSFDWKFIQSKHFDAYYDKGSKYLAEFAILEAEKALQSIQNTLNYSVAHRQKIIIYNSHNEFQQTNVIGQYMPEGVGGVTELFKNRIVVPFQGDYEQFRHVIHHELVHGVLNDMFYGGTFQSALSTGGNVQIPLWMNEGLAEYESLDGMNTETDMFMRDLAISDKIPTLKQLNGYLAYRGGQTFYWYVAEQFGAERVGDIINRLRVAGSLDGAFKSSFNMDLEEFSEQWQKEIKKYYWPDLELFEYPEDFSVELTDHKKDGNFYNSSPAISPDGERMAYIADDDGLFGIYIQSLDDKQQKERLVSSGRQQDFEDLNLLTPGITWDPTGKKIAVSAKSGGSDGIYIIDVDKDEYETLDLKLKHIASVKWSPDGKSLAFVGCEVEQSDLYIYDLENEKLTNVTDDIFSDFDPTFSPNGDRLYFLSDRGAYYSNKYDSRNFAMWNHAFAQRDVYSIDLISGKVARITDSPNDNKTALAISPDEKNLLFVSDANGIANIYRINLESGEIKPITNSITGIFQLSITPDAGKLLFMTQINGGYDIFMMRYPFEKKLAVEKLPLTKYRKSQIEKMELINSVNDFSDADAKTQQSEDIKLRGYEDFDIEFSRQEVVKPNEDARKTDDVDAPDDKSAGGDPLNFGKDTNFVENDYKISFSPDAIVGNPGYSTYFGPQGQFVGLLSDVMGDHQLFFMANLWLDLTNSTFYLQYNYLPEIVDYTIAGYHSAGFILRQDPVLDTLYRFRKFGFTGFASYPLDRYNRVEWGGSLMFLNRDNIDEPGVNEASRTLIVPEGRYVHDDVVWGFLAPMRGSRYYLAFKGAPKLSEDGVGFMTVDADVRHYIPLGNWMSLAFRGAGGSSFGPNPRRFYLGGISSWINPCFTNNEIPLYEPEDYAFMQFMTPLRGACINELNGNNYFITNMEFRFPFLILTPFSSFIQSLMAATFFDVGGAWNNDFKAAIKGEDGIIRPNDLFMSAGIGIRSYLLGFPLKMDVAWQNKYETWSRPRFMFSLGYDY